MDYTWLTTNVIPKDYAQILVIVRRFDGELFTQSGMFFLNNFEGRMKVYLYNSDNWLDFKNDIVGWMYYPKLPDWAREEAERKVNHEERN